MAEENLGSRPDDGPSVPKTGFDAFRGTPLAIVIGLVLGLAAGLVFMFTGVYASCCFFMGYLLVALVLYYVPKLFGADKIKWEVLLAVVFLICSTLFGAMIVSPDAIDRNEFENGDTFDSNGFTNLEIHTDESGNLVFQFEYEKGQGGKIGIQEQRVKYIHYANVKSLENVQSFHGTETDQTPKTEGKSVYTVTLDKTMSNAMYHFQLVLFKSADKDNSDYNTVDKNSIARLYDNNLTEDHKKEIVWMGNFYQSLIVTLVYFVVFIMMFFMNRYLEKTRARMEAEGRLYPQGYGRCKECGTVILPGESCCRKCGAYVDIPDEMRVKKVDSFHCSDCGAEVPADALCCPRCGAKFDEDDEVVIVDKDGKESETVDVQNEAKPEEPKPQEEQKPEEKKEEEKKE